MEEKNEMLICEEVPKKEVEIETRQLRKQQWMLAICVLAVSYLYITAGTGMTLLSDWLLKNTWFMTGEKASYDRAVGFVLVLFTVAFVGIALSYYRRQKRKSGKNIRGVLVLTAVTVLWFPLCDSPRQDIGTYMFLLLHGIAVYWMMALTGQCKETELSEWVAVDLFRGFVILPFSKFFRIWKEGGLAFLWLIQNSRIVCQKGNGKSSNRVLLLIGATICIPLLGIVMPILLSADHYFMMAVEEAFDWFKSVLFGWTREYWKRGTFQSTCICMIPIGSYLYGLFYSCFYGEKPKSAPQYRAPSALLVGFLIPLLTLYGLFFAIRFAGIAGAMGQIAEGEMWVSTYAREGFFELCRIAAINFTVFAVVHRVSSQNGRSMQVLLSILGAETLAFVALAFSKMWYYIQTYQSFTFKRAMCCWLLLTFFVTFGLMMAELWNRKIKGVKWGVVFGCVTFLMMAYSNMPGWAP